MKFRSSWRLISTAVLWALPAFAVEQPICEIQAVVGAAASSSIATGTVYGWALDDSAQFTAYSVTICWGAGHTNCDTPVTANLNTPNPGGVVVANDEFNYTIPSGAVGSVTPKDGARHQIYAYMTLQGSAGTQDCGGGGMGNGLSMPFIWTSSTVGPLRTVQREASPSKGATPQATAVLVNTSDTYSIGTLADVCTGGTPATALGSDGVAGYFVIKRGIPCANVVEISTTVTQDLSEANFTSQVLPSLNSLSASIQFIAIAWVQPSRVVPTGQTAAFGNSICSAVALKSVLVAANFTYNGTTVLVDTSTNPNPYFNTTSKTPFTDFAIRPTMMLVGETCSGCSNEIGTWSASVAQFKTQLDASFGADGTRPTGNADWAYTSDYLRNFGATSASSLSTGGILGSPITATVLGNSGATQSSTISAANIESYQQAAASWSYSSPSFVGGALAFSLTSTSGLLPSGGTQASIGSFLKAGATVSYGTVTEPMATLHKFPDLSLYVPNITDGLTQIEALWKSVELPFQGNFIGDPLSAPYSPRGSGQTGRSASGAITISGGTK